MLRDRFLMFCRRQVRSALLSIGFGAIFSLIFSIGKSHGIELVYTAGVGAVMGVAIWICIATLESLFQPTIDRFPERYRQLAHGLLFLTAGILGWFGGVLLAHLIFGRWINLRSLTTGSALPFIAITAALVVSVGLAFRAFEILRDRLADSIVQLKETEWARKEIEMARSIQTRLLPPQRIEGAGFSIAARNFPAHLVAGDFYDVVQLEDGSVAIVVADVAGKGMGASLIMATVKAVLPFLSRGTVEETMKALNDKLVGELERREFVALAYARFFPADGTLQLANAGFPDPYLVRGTTVQPLSVTGNRLPLGIRGEVRYDTLTTKLQARDRILFVSDGIPEASITEGQPLGYERLAEAVRIGVNPGADAWLEELLARIRREVREPLEDDWTALVLQFTAAARAVA